MAINFPNSPSSGDTHTVSGKIWQWDGEKWKAYGASISPSILKIDTANNRVGINQTTPTVALDVTGAMRVTGDLTIEGTTTTIDSTTIAAQTSLTFEGATADDYETTLTLVDPTADRTITLPNASGTVALTGAVPTTITVADTTDTTAFVALWESATGDLAPKSDAGITYNAGTGVLTATGFAGPLTGNVTGDASGSSGSCTGNAATATAATTATNVVVADTSDTTTNVVLVETATGSSLGAKTDTGLTYNATTGVLSARGATTDGLGGFDGPSILNVDANESGSFTLDEAHAGSFVKINTTSANTVTVPPNSVALPVGTQIIFMPISTGVTTFAAGSGVEIFSQGSTSGAGNDGDLKIDGRYSTAALVKVSATGWYLFGKLTS